MKNNNSLGIVVSLSRCSCIYRHVASFKRSVTYDPFVQRRHTLQVYYCTQLLIQKERNSCQSERPFYSTVVVTFKDHCAFDVGHSFRSIVLSLSLSLSLVFSTNKGSQQFGELKFESTRNSIRIRLAQRETDTCGPDPVTFRLGWA